MATADVREARRRRREAALALRAGMSPNEPATGQFRVATWNVNSLRARTPAIRRFIERTRPDVVLLQETKAAAIAPATAEAFDELGYETAHVGSGGYNGVAIAATSPLSATRASADLGNEQLDREPRLISAVIHEPWRVRLVSLYVPHGREIGHWHYEYKLAFLAALRDQVATWLAEGPLIMGGDFNVAPTDSDIFHPEPFVGHTHVSPEERAALDAIFATGLIDLDAQRWGADQRRFTWWRHGLNYSRNLGMRIDLLAADRSLADRLVTTWIDHRERGADGPSDHAALLADLRIDPS